MLEIKTKNKYYIINNNNIDYIYLCYMNSFKEYRLVIQFFNDSCLYLDFNTKQEAIDVMEKVQKVMKGE